MDIKVLVALIWIDREFSLQTKMMTFGGGNKLCQMFNVS